MSQQQAETWQVSLTGKRLNGATDAELRQQLARHFRLTEAQAGALLKGPRTVKRQLARDKADSLCRLLGKLGLEAVVEATATASPPQPSALQGLAALSRQRLATPRPTPLYVASLLVVTLLCVAMPLIYLGLVAAAATGWLWFLTHAPQSLPVHSIKLMLLLYVVPLVAGLLLLFFLLKPFFTRMPRPPRPVKLDAEREKGLVTGIRALCRAIGISPPKEIHLTWDVNAWVHFRSGWFSLLTGHKVLTIGMPLVAGMTARQFVGVLAHEFGHFSQRVGMRCSFIINSVNRWLEYRAYGEDPWDQRLRQWASEDESGIVSLTVLMAQGVIGLTRLLLRLLFHISLRISRHLSRQMEFDADRYEALLAGSAGFRDSAVRLRVLSHAFAEVNSANAGAWQEGRLLRNLPAAVALYADDFDASRLAAIERDMQKSETRYWDSHPADLDRIENAEKSALPGIYLDDRPAARLMQHFDSACEQVTSALYRLHGLRYDSRQLCAAEDIISFESDDAVTQENTKVYFNGQFRAFPLLDPALAQDASLTGLSWQAAIDRLRSRSPEIVRDWEGAMNGELARPYCLLALNLGLSPAQVGLPDLQDTSPAALRAHYGDLCRETTPLHQRLHGMLALQVFRLRQAGDALAGEARQRFEAGWTLLRALSAEGERLRTLLELQTLLIGLDRAVNAGADEAVARELAAARERYHMQGLGFLLAMESVPQHLLPGGTVAGFLRERHPRLEEGRPDARVFQRVASGLPASTLRLYETLVDDLAGLARQAEQARGIRPIKLVQLAEPA